MRTLVWCVMALSLVGCQTGPRLWKHDHNVAGKARSHGRSPGESAPQATAKTDQRDFTPFEQSARARGLLAGRPASQEKPASRSAASASSTKTTEQNDADKQSLRTIRMMAELEKTKKEKAALEKKLTEETAKQTQQRLELEARLALIQEQLRQQSALQQAMYQQPAPGMSRPTTNYNGPIISAGTPSPAVAMPFSSTPQTYAPQPQQQAVPAWSNSAPTWNAPSTPQHQQVEQWPYSPQRR